MGQVSDCTRRLARANTAERALSRDERRAEPARLALPAAG
jgi:hypothetical protein